MNFQFKGQGGIEEMSLSMCECTYVCWQYFLESQYEKMVPFLFDNECHSFPPFFQHSDTVCKSPLKYFNFIVLTIGTGEETKKKKNSSPCKITGGFC